MSTKKVEIRTKIKGVTFDDPKSGINRQVLIKKFLKRGTRLDIKIEPDNPHTLNALAVWFRDYHLGYLSSDIALELPDLIAKGSPVELEVLEVTGGSEGKENLGVNVVLRFEKTVKDDGSDTAVRGKNRRKIVIGVVVLLFLCLCVCPLLISIYSQILQ